MRVGLVVALLVGCGSQPWRQAFGDVSLDEARERCGQQRSVAREQKQPFDHEVCMAEQGWTRYPAK